ncbi:10043_t:CDS:1, partial [Paraglomus occultum]
MSTILSSPLTKKLVATAVDLSPVLSAARQFVISEPLVFTVREVCTREECADLIALSESNNYEVALINVGGGRQELRTDVRNNSRYIRDDPVLAESLWQRVRQFVPETWNGYTAAGLNERFRFLRYDPGEEFKAHLDGSYVRPDGSERSFLTLQLYLNEGFVGGETSFVANYSEAKVPVVPETGMVLVFEHPLWHEGSKLIEGR